MAQLEILICTTLERLYQVHNVLLPALDDVAYVVSCQGVKDEMASPFQRPDVRFFTMEERGLSRNRNAALAHSRAPFLLLCDDDERLNPQTVLGIAEDFSAHPDADIIQYQFTGTGKHYPSSFVSSVELAMRRKVAEAVRFDERFGQGSLHLCCGEEEVFVYDARKRGFRLIHVPKQVCSTEGVSTGSLFFTDVKVQRSKGATFCLTRGRMYAYYKCTREALGYLLRQGVNPLPLLKNMYWGIRYVSR